MSASASRAAGQAGAPLAYVTGGTRGIGYATAARLARDGWRVRVCGSTEESVALCRARSAEEGLAIEADRVDVREPAAVEDAIARAAAEAPLSALVCAVGGPVPGRLDALARADWERCIALNVLSATDAVRAALGPLRSGGGGSVVLVSSIWALTAIKGRAAYVTAKTALTGLARALALDHGADGIRVNAVAPGFVDTDLLRLGLGGNRDQAETALARLARSHPLGRLVDPEDVANVITFLCGSGARAVTGQTICIDAGLCLRVPLPDNLSLS